MTDDDDLDPGSGALIRSIKETLDARVALLEPDLDSAGQPPTWTDRSTARGSGKRESRWPGPVAAAVLVIAVAAGVAVAVTTLRSSHPTGDTIPTSTFSALPSPSSGVPALPRPSAPHLPGYTAVANSQTQEGQSKKTDIDDLDLLPHYPAQALRWQRNRGADFDGVVPMYAIDGATVIAEWHGLELAHQHVPLTCADHDGIGFALIAPPDDRGAATPVQAARHVYAHIGVSGFGNGRSAWTTSRQTPIAAVVTTGTVTLHATELANGTWVVTGGQRCNS